MKNEEIKGEFKAKGIQKAKEKLDRMKLDEESIKSYDRYINDKRDELSSMNTYKLDLKYAREKGYKKGLVEGIKINTAKKCCQLIKI